MFCFVSIFYNRKVVDHIMEEFHMYVSVYTQKIYIERESFGYKDILKLTIKCIYT